MAQALTAGWIGERGDELADRDCANGVEVVQSIHAEPAETAREPCHHARSAADTGTIEILTAYDLVANTGAHTRSIPDMRLRADGEAHFPRGWHRARLEGAQHVLHS